MNKVMVIAEAGVNHNGDIKIAKQLIDAASAAGADAVKFQTYQTNLLAAIDVKKADYQIRNTGSTHSQYEMLKELELSYEDFENLYDYCAYRNIMFLSSPFDEESMEFLDQLGMEILKIPSGEITNYTYLLKASSQNKPILLSTGMSTLDEIKDAVNLLDPGRNPITLLHCVSNYPTPAEEANLNAIKKLRETFLVPVGYSDHTAGIEIPIAAAALGACVIEKHMTLDKTMPGPDHRASLEPDEFKQMTDGIRIMEQAMGDGSKIPSKEELKNRESVRKYLVAAKDMNKGEVLTQSHLCAKRCGFGISPMKIPELLGTTANRDYKENERMKL
ncbi:N-acetylneuraminate synthase [Clostridium sp. E02]|uniref:N-acetylneuraminate synthase n=1 Tax=Clostridium sp. E02 TaxID=2487134 RepID=UPI000F5341C5|nr:N-acetylneuraminate synthase [Clostridium sp. E02]